MPADLDAIQQQHRYIQAITPLQFGVSIDINQLQFRQCARHAQRCQLALQFFTQAAISAAQQGKTRTQRGGPTPRSTGAPTKLGARVTPGCDSMELAMARTVSGGTSPMAVTR
jgi:hypothetical protein